MEEQRQHFSHRACDVVRARCVVWIVRRVEERLPVRIAHRPRVRVVVAFADGRHRPPEVVVPLAVPGCDAGIGLRQVHQGEQPRGVTELVNVLGDDRTDGPVPQQDEVVRVEVRPGRSAPAFEPCWSAIRAPSLRSTQACTRRLVNGGCGSARNCVGLVMREGHHLSEPRNRHGGEARWGSRRRRRRCTGREIERLRRTPLAGTVTAGKGRHWRESPVIGPKHDDVGRGLLADEDAGIANQSVAGEVLHRTSRRRPTRPTDRCCRCSRAHRAPQWRWPPPESPLLQGSAQRRTRSAFRRPAPRRARRRAPSRSPVHRLARDGLVGVEWAFPPAPARWRRCTRPPPHRSNTPPGRCWPSGQG